MINETQIDPNSQGNNITNLNKEQLLKQKYLIYKQEYIKSNTISALAHIILLILTIAVIFLPLFTIDLDKLSDEKKLAILNVPGILEKFEYINTKANFSIFEEIKLLKELFERETIIVPLLILIFFLLQIFAIIENARHAIMTLLKNRANVVDNYSQETYSIMLVTSYSNCSSGGRFLCLSNIFIVLTFYSSIIAQNENDFYGLSAFITSFNMGILIFAALLYGVYFFINEENTRKLEKMSSIITEIELLKGEGTNSSD